MTGEDYLNVLAGGVAAAATYLLARGLLSYLWDCLRARRLTPGTVTVTTLNEWRSEMAALQSNIRAASVGRAASETRPAEPPAPAAARVVDPDVVMGALARAYCHPDNAAKVLDARLIQSMTDEVCIALQATAHERHGQRARNQWLLEGLRGRHGAARAEEANQAVSAYLTQFETDAWADAAGELPQSVAIVDGVPLLDTDFHYASTEGIDVRWIVAMRVMGFEALRRMLPVEAAPVEAAPVEVPARPAPGERNVELS